MNFMKHYVATALMSVVLIFAASGWTFADAQGKKEEGWKEKMRSEKIAFLTMELSLTPEEAQVFWPVYNASWETRDKYHRQVINTYRELEKAIEEQKSVKELDELLTAYLKALDGKEGLEQELCEKFKQVLPAEKVAKLYVVEEKFRREQINKLHSPKGPAR